MDPSQRIAELEAELAAKDARIAEQGARIAEQDALIAQQTARLAAQDLRIAQLEKQVAELMARLGRNSGNSSLPPSSDPPGSRGGKKGNRAKGGRPRGGQVGHRGSRRALLPVERVDAFVDFFPEQCEHCCAALPETPDPLATRYQLTELPAFEPHTTEFRRHAVDCPRCRRSTRAPYDPNKIPSSPFGPRLMSAVALLTGVYHLSRRRTVQLLSDLVGVSISLGAVSSVEARVSVSGTRAPSSA